MLPFELLDSDSLRNEDTGAFEVSVSSFDKELIFSEDKKNELEALKHHPVYLYFGLLNCLNSKFSARRNSRMEEKCFYNVQDVQDSKLLKYSLNPNLETHLLFHILYNVFCPYQVSVVMLLCDVMFCYVLLSYLMFSCCTLCSSTLPYVSLCFILYYQAVESYGNLFSIYNVQYESLYRQCFDLVLASRKNWPPPRI